MLDGTKDEELYRLLLIAQCNALNSTMPFLFERVHGESELLLPDNLLHSESVEPRERPSKTPLGTRASSDKLIGCSSCAGASPSAASGL